MSSYGVTIILGTLRKEDGIGKRQKSAYFMGKTMNSAHAAHLARTFLRFILTYTFDFS